MWECYSPSGETNIWKERNNKNFRNEARSPTLQVNVIHAEINSQQLVFLPE
jgi:hypothetical protein